MRYAVSHRTVYRYSAPVSQSHHVLHLAPRAHARQKVLSHSLQISPAPASDAALTDDFGNPYSIIAIESDHTELSMYARAQVEVEAPEEFDPARATAWNDVAAQLRANLGAETFEAILYSCPSRHVRPSREIHKFARPSFPQGRPLLQAVQDLTQRIYQGFTYQPGMTDAAALVEDVLRQKRGNCQDFAHLEIAALRSMGLAARYVSGYLPPRPAKGQSKPAGSGALRAWLSVWSPETGWLDFDPANGGTPEEDRIAIAFGRDYYDVSPVSGVLLGGGSHEVEVTVEVTPAE